MSSIKRIYLACRAAVAELGLSNYFISSGILIGMTVLGVFVNQDSDSGMVSALRKEYVFWDPETIITQIAIAGWVSGLIVSGTLYNRWYKEENQAVRTLSLPLSHGERFAAMLSLYLIYVPLVCLITPLLLAIAVYPFISSTIMLPAPIYLWEALAIGWLAHAATCIFWLFPSIAYGKRVAFALIGMIAIAILYSNLTHTNISTVASVPHIATAMMGQDVVGLSNQSCQLGDSPRAVVKVSFETKGNLYVIVQLILASLMLAAAGIALTRKNV